MNRIMYGLYFFELDILVTMTCRYLNVKDVLGRGGEAWLIEDIASYAMLPRYIRLNMLCETTVQVA